MSHVIHANESCHMWYMLMSHVTCANESYHACELFISHTRISHITYVAHSGHVDVSCLEACHTYDTHRSCHTCHVTGDICEWVMSSLFHRHVRIDPVERNVVTGHPTTSASIALSHAKTPPKLGLVGVHYKTIPDFHGEIAICVGRKRFGFFRLEFEHRYHHHNFYCRIWCSISRMWCSRCCMQCSASCI